MNKRILNKVVLGASVLAVLAGCASVSRTVRTYSPEKLTCAELREEWKNIKDFDREATKQGTRNLGYGQIDSRRDDIRKAARAKKCKL
ncbi:MAG: hypothetical protein WBO07_03940 [Formosimonas sp.]|jgi:uncharacterized lipoprotein